MNSSPLPDLAAAACMACPRRRRRRRSGGGGGAHLWPLRRLLRRCARHEPATVSGSESHGASTADRVDAAAAVLLTCGLNCGLNCRRVGDNGGPPTEERISKNFQMLASAFPNATEIQPSTFTEFYSLLDQPVVRSRLPVRTAEAGDTWV
jgi:hypothetical protein